ncbi:MAG: head-tail connector protein [Litorimonas sp.]
MLTDLNPPPAEPISLSEAKAFLRVDHDDEDALIQTLIASARERLESHLNITMVQRSMQVAVSSGETIKLPRWPVLSIDRVTIDGEPTYDFVADLRCRPARIKVDTLGAFEIIFTAGYGAVPSDVPAPLRQAMLLLVARGFEHRDGSSDTLPLMVDALTMPYRVVGL